MLCPTCSDVFEARSASTSKSRNVLIFPHHRDATQLLAAARLGCCLCAPIWSHLPVELQEEVLGSPQDFSQPTSGRDEDDSIGKLIVHLSLDDPDSPSLNDALVAVHHPETWFPPSTISSVPLRHVTWGLFRLVSPEDKDEEQDDGPVPASTSSSSKTWETVLKWIGTCTAGHPSCATKTHEPWYPTRLLGFTAYGSSARVIETKEEECGGPYMTLSHRWGSQETVTLNRATYDGLRHGISIDSLPRLFREAIDVCQRLGIFYLWIDCLCIMQDPEDNADWVREASMMHKIYSDSYLTLSALAAPDSDHSIYNTREPSLLRQSRIASKLEAHHPGESEKQFLVQDLRFWKCQVEHAPLSHRGWVLQERILSNRTLHFGRHQLFWECRDLEASESYPSGVPPWTTLQMKQVDPAYDRDRLRSDPAEVHPLYRTWAQIVSSYSGCGLTKRADKLIALSGIAKFMKSRLFDDDYVAGMWRSNLASELLWSTSETPLQTGEEPFRPSPYRAPSFSWASVDGSIEPHVLYAEPDPLFKVIDVSVEPVTGDVTGLLSGGRLMIQCQLQQLRIGARVADEERDVVEVNGREASALAFDGRFECRPAVMLDERREYFDPRAQEPGTLYCFPARYKKLGEDGVWSLLLRLLDAESGTFARFGLMYFGSGLIMSAEGSAVIDSLRSRSPVDHTLPCTSFSAETRLHTIRIV